MFIKFVGSKEMYILGLINFFIFGELKFFFNVMFIKLVNRVEEGEIMLCIYF